MSPSLPAVASADASRTDLEPIFVVGFLRSGAQSLCDALRAATGLPGPALPGGVRLFSDLVDEVHGQFDRLDLDYRTNKAAHLIANTDPLDLTEDLSAWFAPRWRALGRRWIELFQIYECDHRMPLIIQRLPELFPKARVIFVARPAIENVLSCQRARPDLQVGHIMRHQAAATHAGSQALAAIGASGLVIGQPQMAVEPEAVATKLGAFLSLDPEAIHRLAAALRAPRARQSGFPLESRPLELEDTPWPAPLREHFQRVSEPKLACAGFEVPRSEVPAESPLFSFGYDATSGSAARVEPRSEGWLRADLSEGPIELHYQFLRFEGQGRIAIETRPASEADVKGSRFAFVLRCITAPGQSIEWREEIEASAAFEHDLVTGPITGWQHLVLRLAPLQGPAVATEFRVRFLR